MSDDNNSSGICWGHVLAGAAVTAGVVAAFVVDPSVGQTIIGGAKDIAGGIYTAIGNAGSWVGDLATSTATAASANPAITIGTAATAGALIASTGKKPVPVESHATREDIRRMQAQMIERMQAAGYQPSFALSGQSRY
jgi:hypothetical protein